MPSGDASLMARKRASLKRSASAGQLAFDQVMQGTRQPVGLDVALDEVVLGAPLHGLACVPSSLAELRMTISESGALAKS